MRFELEDEKRLTVLRVVGIGGAGGNAVNRMVGSDFRGVDFVAVNTDLQVLRESKAYEKIQIGEDLTRGLGSGGDAAVGKQSADESIEIIRSCVEGADMVFLAAGMGGGTGTGASPVVAQTARECGALTVGIVTKPFSFEGSPRTRQADTGIEELRDAVDTLIMIPNDKLLETADDDTTMLEAFAEADKVLCNATRGISDLITETGVVNLDFADVKSVMKDGGNALMGTGVASGADAAESAARMAISSPLLGDVSISGASGILVNVTGSKQLGIKQISKAASVINSEAGNDAHVFLGTVINDALPEDEVRITVIATGFDRTSRAKSSQTAQTAQSSQTIREAAAARVAEPPKVDESWKNPAPVTPVAPEPLQEVAYQTPDMATVVESPFVELPSEEPRQQPEVQRETAEVQQEDRSYPRADDPTWGVSHVESDMNPVQRNTASRIEGSESSVPQRGTSRIEGSESSDSQINLAELLERDQTVIELPPSSPAETVDEVALPEQQDENEETIIMDNGSIRSFNSDKFRVPTFVRKQID